MAMPTRNSTFLNEILRKQQKNLTHLYSTLPLRYNMGLHQISVYVIGRVYLIIYIYIYIYSIKYISINTVYAICYIAYSI